MENPDSTTTSITVPENVDWAALYRLYEQHHEQLSVDVKRANVTLGSRRPDMKLEKLTRAEFKDLITHPGDHPGGPEVRIQWLRGIACSSAVQFPWLFPDDTKLSN